MLTCYGDEVHLPQNDLVYIAFRLAALETLCEMDIAQASGEEDNEPPSGFLVEVPLLAQVAPAVQVDLLADAWRRHQAAELHEATLLDAAVVYAAFRTAARILHDQPTLVRRWLKPGPRRVRCRLTGQTPEQLQEMFFEFWDDIDFLSVNALQDLSPEQAWSVREAMGLSEEDIEQMEAALSRGRASPAVLPNLAGLLSEEEIQGYSRVLLGTRQS
jgi:hypothetical protein